MTESETSQQYDLWVDRCRQQLERGAAGNALAAWMQSEGVSAELAAAILQAARGEAADSGQPAGGDAAPATPPETAAPESIPLESIPPETAVPDTTVPETATPPGESMLSPGAAPGVSNEDSAYSGPAAATPTAQPVPPPDEAAAVFAKAFGRAGKMPHDGTMPAPEVPGPPEPAPTATDPVTPQPPAQTVLPQAPTTTSPHRHTHPDPQTPGGPAAAAAMPVTQPAPQNAVSTATTVSPQAPAPDVPPNPFGTPRPPIVFAPASARTEKIPQEGDAPPESLHREISAAPAAGDAVRQDIDTPKGSDVDDILHDESHPPAAGPNPDFGMKADHPPDDSALAETAHKYLPECPEISAPDDSEMPDGLAQPAVEDGDETGEEESADSIVTAVVTAVDAAEQPLPTEPPAEAPTADSAQEEPQPGDEVSGMAAPDEPYRYEEPLEEAASRMGMDLRRSPRQAPAESYDDFVSHQHRQRDPEPSGGAADHPASGPAGDGDVEPADDSGATQGEPAEERPVDRRDGRRPAPVEAADDDGDESARAVRAAGRDEPGPVSSGPTASPEGELARAIREAERGAIREPDSPPPLRDPKTEEELAAAAKELGISFRDDPDTGRPHALEEQEDEVRRAARKLGISFRDDPIGPDPADPDDPTAKAARELGISFRDIQQPERKEKTLLARYWPILLLMVLAALAMPIAAVFFLFAGD